MLMQSELPEGSASIGPGTVVGKYRITGRLGRGAMGVVFLAVHEALGREVAIKFLRREFTVSAELVMRFQREAELVSRIGHPNIVAVYDAGAYEDGSLYYVMERLQGEALSDRMARTPLQDFELGEIFGALLSAVKAAHAIGVVHRDLKPGSVAPVAAGAGFYPQSPRPPRGGCGAGRRVAFQLPW
jgi:serine/threonine-protein kinase